jgi:hypothetical protein
MVWCPGDGFYDDFERSHVPDRATKDRQPPAAPSDCFDKLAIITGHATQTGSAARGKESACVRRPGASQIRGCRDGVGPEFCVATRTSHSVDVRAGAARTLER